MTDIHMFGTNADFLAGLVTRGGRFVIVGGVAVRYYIPDREADDLDVLIEPSEQTAQAVIDALNSCGGLLWPVLPAELMKPKLHWPVKEYYYLDLLTPDAATKFETVWSKATEARVFHRPLPVPVRIASIETLLDMMSKSEKTKHANDAKRLREVRASS
jgi:hypothetical protein